jgi:hypothetical protein
MAMMLALMQAFSWPLLTLRYATA